MSGYRVLDEAWERRKMYLIRSLFEDTPLSVIREEQEDSSTRAENTQALDEHREHSIEAQDSSSSPLPELIIEVEKRPTCDESPEFYKKLEIRMKALVKKYLLRDETGKEVGTCPEHMTTESDVSSIEKLSGISHDVNIAADSNVSRDLSDQERDGDEADNEDRSEAEPEEEATNVLAVASVVSSPDTSKSSTVRSPQIMRRRCHSHGVTANDVPLKKRRSSQSAPTPRAEVTFGMEPDMTASTTQSDEEVFSSTPSSGDDENALATTSTSKTASSTANEQEDPLTSGDREVSIERRIPSPSSPNEFHYGRPSPLPEFIIEVGRKPPCDESPEFYKKLEIRMKDPVKKYLYENKTSKADASQEHLTTDSDVSSIEKLSGDSQAVHDGTDSNASRDLSDQERDGDEADSEDRSEAEPEEEATNVLATTTDVSRENTSAISIVRSPEIMRSRKSDSIDITLSKKKMTSPESPTTPRRPVTHDMESDVAASNGQSVEGFSTALLSNFIEAPTTKSGSDSVTSTSTARSRSGRRSPTPKSGRDLFTLTSVERRSSRRRNRHVPYSTSGHDRSVETADEPERAGSDSTGRNILNNLFVGTPTIFKLCSCIDHECQ